MSKLATCPICGRKFNKVSGVFFGDEACKKLICPKCVNEILMKKPEMLRYLWYLKEGEDTLYRYTRKRMKWKYLNCDPRTVFFLLQNYFNIDNLSQKAKEFFEQEDEYGEGEVILTVEGEKIILKWILVHVVLGFPERFEARMERLIEDVKKIDEFLLKQLPPVKS